MRYCPEWVALCSGPWYHRYFLSWPFVAFKQAGQTIVYLLICRTQRAGFTKDTKSKYHSLTYRRHDPANYVLCRPLTPNISTSSVTQYLCCMPSVLTLW